MIIPAKKLDGTPCVVEFVDKGDTVPAFDARGERILAYTAAFRVDSGDWTYVQTLVDRRVKKLAARSGPSAIAQIRETQDLAALAAAGIDITELDFENARA